MIQGITYSADSQSLLTLPSDLDPVKACQNSNEQTVTFFGYASPLSNFHAKNFQINGITYNSVEQYIQSKKAEQFNDDTALAKIMSLTSPAIMKSTGKHIRNFNKEDWTSKAKQIAMEGVRAKFTQNTELKNYLISTGSKTIGEASLDKFWGTGKKLNQPDTLITEGWIGENSLGEILMEIRSELKKAVK